MGLLAPLGRWGQPENVDYREYKEFKELAEREARSVHRASVD